MSDTAAATDMGFGLAMVFGLVALAGAGGMYVTHHQQVLAGASFAVAVTAGILAVIAVHLYE